jgi:DnaJ like chaperone protein
MSWLGKIIGGGIGMAMGGPIGAIIGAGLGHTFVDSKPAGRAGAARLSQQETRQAVFFATTFTMLGKMAKADGRVSREEVQVAEEFMKTRLGLDARSRQFAIGLFNEAKDNPTPFRDYADQFGEVFADARDVRLMLFELLFTLAMADGTMHPAEDRLLQEALAPLRLPRAVYDDLRGGSPDLDHFYAVLEVSPEASDGEVKRAYRKAARDFHPDTIVSKGLPEEFTKFAETKFKEVNQAYETIMDRRSAR